MGQWSCFASSPEMSPSTPADCLLEKLLEALAAIPKPVGSRRVSGGFFSFFGGGEGPHLAVFSGSWRAVCSESACAPHVVFVDGAEWG